MSARRKPEAMMSVKQPFDPEKFNFNKVQDKEVVFQASPGTGSSGTAANAIAAGLFRAHCISNPTLLHILKPGFFRFCIIF